MLHILSLILPVLVPSWRFFQSVEPSPRIQWALDKPTQTAVWQEFWPRPAHVTLGQMLVRLLWNPARNEALFVVSCAERIALGYTVHSVDAINARICNDLRDRNIETKGLMLRFRLVFVSRSINGWSEDIVFQSTPIPADGSAKA